MITTFDVPVLDLLLRPCCGATGGDTDLLGLVIGVKRHGGRGLWHAGLCSNHAGCRQRGSIRGRREGACPGHRLTGGAGWRQLLLLRDRRGLQHPIAIVGRKQHVPDPRTCRVGIGTGDIEQQGGTPFIGRASLEGRRAARM